MATWNCESADSSDWENRLENDFVVASQYRLVKKIGYGSFGDVFLATNLSNGEEVAAKLERADLKYPQLFYEWKVYQLLKGDEHIPRMHYFGLEHGYKVLIMDLLGPDLEALFVSCARRFSLKTVLMLIPEMINRIEYVHSKNYIHRDIKPENFVMGTGSDCNKLFLIDYGLAKRYRDGFTHAHIRYREGKKLTGTARYASLNSHMDIEQSRRDDMEALGYLLVYFARGSLPWQGVVAARAKQKYEKIADMKMSTPLASLCARCPPAFAQYLNYCRQLRFDECPDYAWCRDIFRSEFEQRGYRYDYVFDWTKPAEKNPLSNSNKR